MSIQRAESCVTFANLLNESVARCPDRVAIRSLREDVTYAELDKRVNRTANVLREKGIRRREHVAIVSINSPEYLEVLLACGRADIVAVLINWRLSPEEIARLLVHNDVSLAFVEIQNDEWLERLRKITRGMVELVDMAHRDNGASEFEKLLAAQPDTFVPVEIDPDDVALHFHTSGTTGMPKSVMHSHRILDAVLATQKKQGFGDGDIYFFMSQFFHVALLSPCGVLHMGGTVLLAGRFDAEAFLCVLEREHVTRCGASPSVVGWLLEQYKKGSYDLSSLKAISYSSSLIPLPIIQEATRLWHCDFYNTYGLTEVGGGVTTLDSESHLLEGGKYLASVGKPNPGCSVKIVDENGEVCPADTVGEILVKTPAIMKGYYKQPELLEKSMTDGWFHTKDMGYVDKWGYLFCMGRKDDMFISGGENVYPKDIENLILEKFLDIQEAAVFGVPDERWGMVPCACLIRRKGGTVTAELLRTELKRSLAHYKIPKEFYFVEQLPRNTVGKVLKAELQRQYSAKRDETDSACAYASDR